MRDYRSWNNIKQLIEHGWRPPVFHEREVWWCSIGINIGQEEDGKHEYFERPVLIFRKFNRDLFLGFPLSSVYKQGSFFFPVTLHGTPRTILFVQIRSYSAKRLRRRLVRLTSSEFLEVERAWRKLTGF